MCVHTRTCQGRSRETSSKAPTIIQVRADDDGLDQGGSNRGGKNGWNLELF